MEDKIEHSFEDQPVSKFCYDIDNKRIEVHYNWYYDLLKSKYIEKSWIYIIENWKEAKSKVVDNERLYPLERHIGIFSMILHMEIKNRNLEIVVITIDNRYITLIFLEPKLSLKYG